MLGDEDEVVLKNNNLVFRLFCRLKREVAQILAIIFLSLLYLLLISEWKWEVFRLSLSLLPMFFSMENAFA